MTSQTNNPQPEVVEHLFQLCLGYIASISLNVVAQLSIADQLAQGPKTIEDLARDA